MNVQYAHPLVSVRSVWLLRIGLSYTVLVRSKGIGSCREASNDNSLLFMNRINDSFSIVTKLTHTVKRGSQLRCASPSTMLQQGGAQPLMVANVLVTTPQVVPSQLVLAVAAVSCL